MHELALLLANPALEIAGIILAVLVLSHVGAEHVAPDVRLVPNEERLERDLGVALTVARLTPDEARRRNREIELRLAREALAGPLGGLERRRLLERIDELERLLGTHAA